MISVNLEQDIVKVDSKIPQLFFVPSTLKEHEMGSLSSAYRHDSLICDISRVRTKPVRDPESQDRRHAERTREFQSFVCF